MDPCRALRSGARACRSGVRALTTADCGDAPDSGCYTCVPPSGVVRLEVAASATLTTRRCCAGVVRPMTEVDVAMSAIIDVAAPPNTPGCTTAGPLNAAVTGSFGSITDRTDPCFEPPGETTRVYDRVDVSASYICRCDPSPLVVLAASVTFRRVSGFVEQIVVDVRSSPPRARLFNLGGSLLCCPPGESVAAETTDVGFVAGSAPHAAAAWSGECPPGGFDCPGDPCASEWTASVDIRLLGLLEGGSTGCAPGEEPSGAVVAPTTAQTRAIMRARRRGRDCRGCGGDGGI